MNPCSCNNRLDFYLKSQKRQLCNKSLIQHSLELCDTYPGQYAEVYIKNILQYLTSGRSAVG